MKNFIVPAVALMALAGVPAVAVSASDAVEVTRLSDRAIVLRLVPDPSEFNNIVALKTAKGIVVVDTHLSPYTASLIRRRILEEFQADSVAYVINTTPTATIPSETRPSRRPSSSATKTSRAK